MHSNVSGVALISSSSPVAEPMVTTTRASSRPRRKTYPHVGSPAEPRSRSSNSLGRIRNDADATSIPQNSPPAGAEAPADGPDPDNLPSQPGDIQEPEQNTHHLILPSALKFSDPTYKDAIYNAVQTLAYALQRTHRESESHAILDLFSKGFQDEKSATLLDALVKAVYNKQIKMGKARRDKGEADVGALFGKGLAKGVEKEWVAFMGESGRERRGGGGEVGGCAVVVPAVSNSGGTGSVNGLTGANGSKKRKRGSEEGVHRDVKKLSTEPVEAPRPARAVSREEGGQSHSKPPDPADDKENKLQTPLDPSPSTSTINHSHRRHKTRRGHRGHRGKHTQRRRRNSSPRHRGPDQGDAIDTDIASDEDEPHGGGVRLSDEMLKDRQSQVRQKKKGEKLFTGANGPVYSRGLFA